MNNYPYLIKAKAKANEAKSLFCWFSAKSDSRAERKILDIPKTLKLTLPRRQPSAADPHQLAHR